MKRYMTLLALAVAVAAISFFHTRGLAPQAAEDQKAWLQREFKLSPAQMAAVDKLQSDYQPVCTGHCRLIMEARDRLAAHPADAAAQADVTRLEGVCHDATMQHLREVAAVMAPDQGRRFLTLVEPKVSRHQHEGPLGL